MSATACPTDQCAALAGESRNAAAERAAVDRLLTITGELVCDLEPETEQLLGALTTPDVDFDDLLAESL